jgi:hypothetical protein
MEFEKLTGCLFNFRFGVGNSELHAAGRTGCDCAALIPAASDALSARLALEFEN